LACGAAFEALAGFADAAHAAIDGDVELGGSILDAAEVLVIEPAVIFERGELDGVELLGGGVVEELDALPLECAERVGVEAQFDGGVRRGEWHQGGGNGL